jgi:Family of unknown function (DUF6178)
VKPASGEPPPSNVVELSRFRADLSRGRRVRRADALLSAADPRRAIRALPGDEFYYVLHEVGFPDAADILAHGTPEQVQSALDFAVWDRDQLDLAATETWLDAMVSAPLATVAGWAKGLDIELLALLLRKRTRVYDVSLEEPPEEPEGTFWPTPDRLFILDLLGDEDQQRVTLGLLEALYRSDHQWTRRVLVGTRGDLDSELEEHAFRWRSGRMADLGFPDYYEALEVYREIDPARVQLGDQPTPRVLPLSDQSDPGYLRMPSALAERLTESAPFARAVAGVTDRQELANLQAALVALANRVLAADRISPGDDVAASEALARTSATLDLAVEFLARGSADQAVQAVRTVPLQRLFQLGTSLVGKVRRLAVALLRRTPYARLTPPLQLFEDEDAGVLAACNHARPLFPRRLDQPPAAGERPFASLADLQLATAALERAGAALTLVFALGWRPETLQPPAAEALGVGDVAQIDAGTLARTSLARRLLDLPASGGALGDLDRRKLEELLKPARDSAEQRQLFLERSKALLLAAWPGSPPVAVSAAAHAVATRWAQQLLEGEPVLLLVASGPP